MRPREEFETNAADLLARQPDAVWIRDGLALVGWGIETRFDLGIGSDRFARAAEISKKNADAIGFASLTFSDTEPGSVLVYPASLARVGAGGVEVLAGSLPSKGDQTPIPAAARPDVDDRAQWHQAFAKAMAAIDGRELEKVVLSRTVDIDFGGDVPPSSVAAALAFSGTGLHTFVVESLVGSSPELLVALADDTIRSVSLAGSARSGDPASTSALGSDKSMTEHVLAADSVEDALAAHCLELERRPMSTVGFGAITHLLTSFTGKVRSGTTVFDVLRDLHPTAAVAGTPTKKAIELINEIEREPRGRYAGPVGWVDGNGNGEFAIALRCGQINGSRVRLHAGAGLVAGSDVDAEYAETELKLGPMVTALGVA